jgi:prophage regulatory protein
MKLLRLEEVIEMTGLSRSSIYRYEGNSAFPKRRRTGPNTVRWLEADVVAWMESRPVIVPVQIEDLPPRNPHRPREH